MPHKNSPSRENGRKTRRIYPFLIVPLLSVALIAGLLSMYVLNVVHAAPTSQPVPFRGTLPKAIAQSKLVGPADTNQTISLSIGLKLRNADVLNNYVKDISNPKSVNFHRYLTASQFESAFAPSLSTYADMLQYLQKSGFSITQTYKHRMLIVFSGSVGLTEQVFHVIINNYTAHDGSSFYSNASDPLLPASLVASIQDITGLNNAAHLTHTPISQKTVPVKTVANSPTISCPTHGTNYFTPDQTATAYNLNGLYNAGFHGEGQTIGLFELDTTPINDIKNYESCFGHSHASIQSIVTHGPVPSDSGQMEVELDAELILSAAPALGQLRIYEASNDTTGASANWAQIVQDAVPVVSTSWGLCEYYSDPNLIQQENNYFLTAAIQGQTVFAAAGDTGSAACAQASSSQTFLSVQDPASQPYVTSVGGTTLSINVDSSYQSETTWNNSSGAGGGGLSTVWSLPSWQNAPGVNNQYSNGSREVPDVSLNADPFAGYVIYCSVNIQGQGCNSAGGFYIFGGTSAAAPMWAAFMALTNEESIHKGGFNIGFTNPLLYQIASSGNSYYNDFHDINNNSNNDYNGDNNGLYPTASVYDMATGLGSYNAANLANDLVNLTLNAPGGARLSPAAPTWYFAEGYIGNGFEELLTVQNPSLTLAATVTFTYIFPNGSPKVVTHHFNASSRSTVDVNNDLNLQPNSSSHITVSTIVQVAQGSPNIVVERPMYFKYVNGSTTIQSGTDVVGATQPGTSYYFPEADSRQSGSAHYFTYITMLNPSSSVVDNVTVTYYTGSCTTNCPQEQFTLQPHQRATASPIDAKINLHQQLAISVTSNNPVVVERPMYVADNIPTAGGNLTGAASQIGATSPGKDWLFAEGYTGADFQQYFVLANFGATTANAVVTMEYNGGTTKTQNVVVPAYSHVYVNVNTINGNTPEAAAEITADQPIVADRLMYFHQGSAHIAGITDVVGEAGPASHSVYAFSEGYTGGSGGNFQEVVTVLNPTNNAETVALTIFTPSAIFQQQLVIVAHSRWTFNINAILNPIQQGENSITIQALGQGSVIVAERPMYYTMTIPHISGTQQGGTDVLGFTG